MTQREGIYFLSSIFITKIEWECIGLPELPKLKTETFMLTS